MLKKNLDQLSAVRRQSLAAASQTPKERLALDHLEDLRQELAQALDRPGSAIGRAPATPDDSGSGLHRR